MDGMENLFARQMKFQSTLTGQKLPTDSRLDFRDQICLMTEELGELAKTDKRWRKERTSPSGDKLDEIADVFIVAMNLAMYSGFTYNDIVEAISDKLRRNEERFLP